MLTLSPSPASQRNFIVASVDVRGSGFQGEEFKHAVYRWSLNGRESIIAKTLKLFQLMIVKFYIYISLFFLDTNLMNIDAFVVLLIPVPSIKPRPNICLGD